MSCYCMFENKASGWTLECRYRFRLLVSDIKICIECRQLRPLMTLNVALNHAIQFLYDGFARQTVRGSVWLFVIVAVLLTVFDAQLRSQLRSENNAMVVVVVGFGWVWDWSGN